METKPSPESVYDLKSNKLPYFSGFMLKLFVNLLEGPLHNLLIPNLFKTAGISALREQTFDEPITVKPLALTGHLADKSYALPTQEWPDKPGSQAPGFHFNSVFDYARAYRSGKLSPVDVAEKVLNAIESSNNANPPLRAMVAVERDNVLEQARQSAERIKSGRPLGIFDGVPVAVKEEFDLLPYPTTVGTSFLGKSPCQEDSTVAARMRGAGSLMIGKANMHEIGIGVTGLNANSGTTRNPYHTDHFTGGSSSGPATAVAAGLCPVAIGADGGGSIRIPSAFCGLVGIKPTFGRVSEHGAYPLCWSVAHNGPIAASATDAALGYAAMAGPDLLDENSLHQPLPTLKDWDHLKIKGLRLGVFWPWFRHANPQVVTACELMLHQFESLGAVIQEVSIADLEAGRVAQLITIASEMATTMDSTYAEHYKEHGLDVRTNLALAHAFVAQDYVKAQQVRTRLIRNFEQALENVDMLITPTTAVVAPRIPADALPDGNSDLTVLMEIMRYTTPSNMTGHPAITFPVGYDPEGLPIGMQAIGHYWQEAALLGLALVAEGLVERKAPSVYYNLLEG